MDLGQLALGYAFSQVLISVLTLCFCFGMIGQYKGQSQKAYWLIVTIIIGCKCFESILCYSMQLQQFTPDRGRNYVPAGVTSAACSVRPVHSWIACVGSDPAVKGQLV
jgi:hypothetical protein